jgi:Cu2+-exporting ATPase
LSQAAAHLHWQGDGGLEQLEFFAEGMHCANCARSIRSRVGALPGVQRVDVNLTTARVSVAWDPRRSRLGTLLDTVEGLGFHAVPLNGAAGSDAQRVERRRMQKRIGLAALAAMQMSMYTVGLYAGAWSGIDPWIEQLLRVTAMLIAVPVMLYSGAPFLSGAWHDLRRRTLGMDVPVAAALLLAFVASVINTWRGSGQIYFDSVAMFICFLLVGRYVEMNVRRTSLNAGEALVRSLPTEVTRLLDEDRSERIGLQQVNAGDRLLVPLGAVIPVDCILESASTLVDESLITGEAVPVTRAAGAPLPGGAINRGAVCTVRASSDARHSTLASMAALIERSQAERPPQALAADRAAAQFVFWIVLLAAAVAGFWYWFDPARAFEATLAVLVVTCPCALSLATPVAIAAASTRLARRGMLITRADALERLAGVDSVVLDKSGTLTSARMQLAEVRCLGTMGRDAVLALAASLEQQSAHPLAGAFTAATQKRVAVSDLIERAGQGLEGSADGVRWRIGRREYVAELGHKGAQAAAAAESGADFDADDYIWLGSATGCAAAFALTDTLRPDAAAAIAALRELGLTVRIASGDRRSTVARLAGELGIAAAAGRMDPEAKLRLIRELQAQGHRVLMIGDGINDGPVLAAAHVSCAMGGGAALAHAAADLLLMNESLLSVAAAVRTARGATRLVRANLRWALGYNLCAVPLAAAGLVSPWLAALGMSASSLYVVERARRFAGGDA